MKKIVWTRYGPPEVLQLQEVEKPTPKDNEILVKVIATTVTAGDCEARALKFPLWLSLPMRMYAGVRRPTRITSLGQEMAGEIEAVGKDVRRFKAGDRVFGSVGLGQGTYAEYITLPEDGEDNVLAIMPSNMSYEEAATVPTGGLESAHFLGLANIQPGQTVLINGAGGSIGTYGVQLARYYDAEVTAVDHTSKLDMLRSLGAEHVVDYTKEDYTSRGETYDVIFDVVGKGSLSRGIGVLNEGGVFLMANPRPSLMLRGMLISSRSSKKVIATMTGRNDEDLILLRDLIEAGHLKSVIDRRYPLEETAEAHRYVETGMKAGNVVIKI